MNVVIFVFFFQAEDGIRDLTVTGVQTCALPIFSVMSPRILFIILLTLSVANCRAATLDIDKLIRESFVVDSEGTYFQRTERSEERRVGKECRSRWSPYSKYEKVRGDVMHT